MYTVSHIIAHLRTIRTQSLPVGGSRRSFFWKKSDSPWVNQCFLTEKFDSPRVNHRFGALWVPFREPCGAFLTRVVRLWLPFAHQVSHVALEAVSGTYTPYILVRFSDIYTKKTVCTYILGIMNLLMARLMMRPQATHNLSSAVLGCTFSWHQCLANWVREVGVHKKTHTHTYNVYNLRNPSISLAWLSKLPFVLRAFRCVYVFAHAHRRAPHFSDIYSRG